jgi:signal transduction histidine kinase
LSGNFLLDWAVMLVSFFNTILLLWLGLTVLLNAERRTLGIWLSGGGMLVGGAFFLCHTAILGLRLNIFGPAGNFWWHLGWVLLIVSPFAWYVVMLWYSGFWEGLSNPVYRRQRPWFWLLILLSSAMLVLFIFTNPLPSFLEAALLNLNASPEVMGVPIILVFYPLYILACIGLSLDALLHPGPTVRMMGDLARQRARPWLLAASLGLFLVSLLVSGIIVWIALLSRKYTYDAAFILRTAIWVYWADLLIASLIAISVTLTGQAMVSYEVFTGNTLPRQGLLHYWQRAVMLALGYSASISLSLALNMEPIYSLLLSTCLLVLFYALLSWRAYIERDRLIASLRPFVSSQQRYAQMLSQPEAESPGPGLSDMRQPFNALCETLLETRQAYLLPLGWLTPLFGPSLAYPERPVPTLPKLAELTTGLTPQELCRAVDPASFGGASWAIPLWSERGLCGVLLLGPKTDQGLYSQEEIEIARSTGERLLESQASAEMARRLMGLQRQRLSESQVLDRRARRVLHDDILPRLHAAMLSLSSGSSSPETVEMLAEIHHQIADLLHAMPVATPPELVRLGLVSALQQVIQGELNDAFDEVVWDISPQANQLAEHLPALSAEVLFYATREVMRNAARHARPAESSAPLQLKIVIQCNNDLEILVMDNGIGIGNGNEPGDGHGLALHSTLLAVVGGTLSVESMPEASTCIRLSLPGNQI